VVSNGSGRRSLSPKLIGVPSPDLMIEQGLALQLLAEGANGTTDAFAAAILGGYGVAHLFAHVL